MPLKNQRLPPTPCPLLTTRVVLTLRVPLQLIAVEIDLAQIARGIALRLVVEMLRRGIAVLTSGGDCAGAHAIAEFNRGDERVAAGAVHLLGAGIGARAERSKRAPAR